MKHRVEEQDLLRRLAALPREIPPRRDPWATIATRISKARGENAGRWTQPTWVLAAVACSVVAVLAAGLLLSPLREPLPAGSNSMADSRNAGRLDESGLPVTLAASEAEYQAAFREFIDLGRARPGLSPRTLESIEAGWAALRASESALSTALSGNPDDRFLNDRMLELRARQLGFLQRLASLEQSNRRLTT